MLAFNLGGTERQHVRLDVHSHVGASQRDHEFWLDSEVSLHVGAFSGKYRASFTRDELQSFRVQLQSLYDTLKGEAMLVTLEHQLELTLTGNGRGGIELKGEAQDSIGFEGSTLTFRLSLDQTHIASALRELEALDLWLSVDA